MGTFESILQGGISRGHIPARTQQSRDWYRSAAKDFGARLRGGDLENAKRVDYARLNPSVLLRENQSHLTTNIIPGNMYMYYYDPKFKETLPFYDRFPMIFPFRVQADRFWGINLHYLPLQYRAILMDGLYDLTNNKKYDETTRINLSYKILNNAAKFRYFKPCVKQYLKSHVESKFLYITPDTWDVALFLPLEKFEKKTKAQVWANSREKLRV